jgi:hypothetical protein
LAWWVVAAVADLEWPATAVDIATALEGLTWHWFDDGSPETGWLLRIAVAMPTQGLAWAMSATDGI